MMTAVKAYYDGTTFVPLQKYTFKPSQQVLIVVDEEPTVESPAQRFLKLSWHGDESADEILKSIADLRTGSGLPAKKLGACCRKLWYNASGWRHGYE